jgi:aspartyl-tRNA(Asn)/glutamyl-tRNA(Gln) amidotransferase subunit A
MEDRDRPLWSLNAGELSAAYANGLSPRSVVEATLARIRDINPKLNAIITLDEAGVANAAEASARRWKDGRPLGTLDGVPVTIKDNILAAGLRAIWGSRLYENFVPDKDELPVRRLREAAWSFSARPMCPSSRSTVLPTMRYLAPPAIPGIQR